MRRPRTSLAVAALALSWIVTAHAADPVGAVSALDGRAEAIHPGAGAWTALAVGDGILLGDQLRTFADSKLELLFRDDSVLTLAAESQLTVDESMVGAAAPTSHFTLTVGRVRALVTERYRAPGARFEMETPTAVAGVRGTGFIAEYDTQQDETVVIGLFDTTLVRARRDPQGRREIALGPGQRTTVRRGSYPIEPTRIPDDVLRSLSAATSVRPGGGGAAGAGLAPLGKGASAPGEPRLPRHAGELTPEGRVVDQPIPGQSKTPGKPPPPPPPPPPPVR